MPPDPARRVMRVMSQPMAMPSEAHSLATNQLESLAATGYLIGIREPLTSCG